MIGGSIQAAVCLVGRVKEERVGFEKTYGWRQRSKHDLVGAGQPSTPYLYDLWVTFGVKHAFAMIARQADASDVANDGVHSLKTKLCKDFQ